MRQTDNLGLALYDTTDKMNITGSESSLNHNMEILDQCLHAMETVQIEDRAVIGGDQMIPGVLIDGTGATASAELWECTDYIDISKFRGEHVRVSCTIYGIGSAVMYDESKTFLVSITGDNISDYNGTAGIMELQELSFVLPENVKYLRACAMLPYKNNGSISVSGTRRVPVSALMQELSGRVSETEASIGGLALLNLFDRDACEIGKAMVSGADTVVSNSDLMLSDYILLKANTIYYANDVFLSGNYAFYDGNKNYISSPDVSIIALQEFNYRKGMIITRNQQMYARFTTLQTAEECYISEFQDFYAEFGKRMTLDEKIALSAKAKVNGNRVLVLGDSISADYYGDYKKWVTMLMEDGVLPPSTTNSSYHATGFVATYQDDASLRFYNRLGAIADKESYDFVIVFGGINDYIQAVPMGGETDSTDPDTYFKPAVDRFFSYLIQNFTHARICVLLPLRTYNIYKNTAGHFQQEYAQYIGEVAKSYCLPVLNLTEESGFCPFVEEFKAKWTLIPEGYTSPDGVHPTEEYERKFLSRMIRNFLLTL